MTKQVAPERIYNWLNTQLSIARFYGGCTYNGASYDIAWNEEGQPLVRTDVLAKEKKASRKKAKESSDAEKSDARKKQTGINFDS